MPVTRETQLSPEMELRLEAEEGLKILGKDISFDDATMSDLIDASKVNSYSKISKAMEAAHKAAFAVPEKETRQYKEVMESASEIVNKKKSFPETGEKLEFSMDDLDNKKYLKKIEDAVNSGKYPQDELISYTEKVALANSREAKSRLGADLEHSAELYRMRIEDIKNPKRGTLGYQFETINNSRALGFSRAYINPSLLAMYGEDYATANKRAAELVAAHEPTGAMDELVQMAAQNADQMLASTGIMAAGAGIASTGAGSAIGAGMIMSGATMAAGAYSGINMGTDTYLDLRMSGVDKNAAMLGASITGSLGGAIEVYLTNAIARPLAASVGKAARIANLYGIGAKKGLTDTQRKVLTEAVGQKVADVARRSAINKQQVAAKSLLIDNLKKTMSRPSTVATLNSVTRDFITSGLGGGLEEFTQEILEMAVQETARQNAGVEGYIPRRADGRFDQKAIMAQLAEAIKGGILLEALMGGIGPVTTLPKRIRSDREFNKVLGDIRSHVRSMGIKYNGEAIATEELSDSVIDMISREILYEGIKVGKRIEKGGKPVDPIKAQNEIVNKVLKEVRDNPLPYIIADNTSMNLKSVNDDGSVVVNIGGKDHLLRPGDLIKDGDQYKLGRYLPDENGMPVIEVAGPFQNLFGHETGHAVLGTLDLATKKKIIDNIADAKGLDDNIEAEEGLADAFAEIINPEAKGVLSMFLNDITTKLKGHDKKVQDRVLKEMALGYIGKEMDFSFLKDIERKESSITGEPVESVAEEDVNIKTDPQTGEETVIDDGTVEGDESGDFDTSNRDIRYKQKKLQKIKAPDSSSDAGENTGRLSDKIRDYHIGRIGQIDKRTGRKITVTSAMRKTAAVQKYIREVLNGTRQIGQHSVMLRQGVLPEVIIRIDRQIKSMDVKPASKAGPRKTAQASIVSNKGNSTQQKPKTFKSPNRVLLPKTSQYTAKDQAKSYKANKFIGRGSKGSSTAAYAKAWGNRANTGQYSDTDKVFISAEGKRKGRRDIDFNEIRKAVEAGATIITDRKADRSRPYNVGERQLEGFLQKTDYVEIEDGVWRPRNLDDIKSLTDKNMNPDKSFGARDDAKVYESLGRGKTAKYAYHKRRMKDPEWTKRDRQRRDRIKAVENGAKVKEVNSLQRVYNNAVAGRMSMAERFMRETGINVKLEIQAGIRKMFNLARFANDTIWESYTAEEAFSSLEADTLGIVMDEAGFKKIKQASRNYAKMYQEFIAGNRDAEIDEYGRWASDQIEEVFEDYSDDTGLIAQPPAADTVFTETLKEHVKPSQKHYDTLGSHVIREGYDTLRSRLADANAILMYHRELQNENRDLGPNQPATRETPVLDTERQQDINRANNDEVLVPSEYGTKRISVIFPPSLGLYYETFMPMLDMVLPKTGNTLIDATVNGVLEETATEASDQFNEENRINGIQDIKIGGSRFYQGAANHMEKALGDSWALKLEWAELLYRTSSALSMLEINYKLSSSDHTDVTQARQKVEAELRSLSSELYSAAESYKASYPKRSYEGSVLSLYHAVDKINNRSVMPMSSRYVREGITRFFEDRGFNRRPAEIDPAETLRSDAADVRSRLRDEDDQYAENDILDAESGMDGFSYSDSQMMHAIHGIDLSAEGLQERVTRILTERLYDADSAQGLGLNKNNQTKHDATAVMGIINAPGGDTDVSQFHAQDIRRELAGALKEVLEWAQSVKPLDASQREVVDFSPVNRKLLSDVEAWYALETADEAQIAEAEEMHRFKAADETATRMIRRELGAENVNKPVETTARLVYRSARDVQRGMENQELSQRSQEVKDVVDMFADMYLEQANIDPKTGVRFKTSPLKKANERAELSNAIHNLFAARDVAIMDTDMRSKELRDTLLRDVFMVEPDEKLRSILKDMVRTVVHKTKIVTSTLGLTKTPEFESLTGTEKMARYNELMDAATFAAEALSSNETTIEQIEEAIDTYLASEEAAKPENKNAKKAMQKYKSLMPTAKAIVNGEGSIETRMRDFITGAYADNNKTFQKRFKLGRYTDNELMDIYVPRLFMRSGFADETSAFSDNTVMSQDLENIPGPPGSGRFSMRKLTLPESLARGKVFQTDNLLGLLDSAQIQAVNYIADRKWIIKSLDSGYLRSSPALGYSLLNSPRAQLRYYKFNGKLYNTWGQAKAMRDMALRDAPRRDRAALREKRIERVKEKLYAPEKFADTFNKITAPSKIRQNKYLSQVLAASSMLKSIKISWGMFHRRAFIWSALFGGVMPKHSKTYDNGMAARMANYGLRRQHGLAAIKQHDFLLYALASQGMTLFKSQDFAKNSYKFNTAVSRMTDKFGPAATIAQWTQRMQNELFTVFGSSMKAATATNEYYHLYEKYKSRIEREKTESEETGKLSSAAEAYIEAFGELPEGVDARYSKTEEKILSSVAGLVNADFGGEHLGRLGVSATAMDSLRLLFLGPDWTMSNLRSFTKGLWHDNSGEGGAGSWTSSSDVERRLYRAFWARVLGRSLMLTFVINSLMSPFDKEEPGERIKKAFKAGQFKWFMADITPLMDFFGNDGSRFYFNTAGQFIDPFKYVTYPAKSFYHKGAPLFKAGVNLWTGSRYDKKRPVSVRDIPSKGLYAYDNKHSGPVRPDEVPAYLIYHMLDAMPIQIRNNIDIITGESNRTRSVLEAIGVDVKQSYPRK